MYPRSPVDTVSRQRRRKACSSQATYAGVLQDVANPRRWRHGRSNINTPSEVLVRLVTERLVLREFEDDDWQAVLAYSCAVTERCP
jgi:hypothetical protein